METVLWRQKADQWLTGAGGTWQRAQRNFVGDEIFIVLMIK